MNLGKKLFMRSSLHLSAVCFACFAATIVNAQTHPSTAPIIPAPFTSSANIYSGISGPGKPVVGNGGGGYRSGYEGLMYDGVNPKQGWLPLGQHASTSSAVKEGLIPPLKPIWDLHLRDTVICVGGDGLYYMTGSSGDNIWDRNDGIELWRSKDFQHWNYLGLVWSFDKDGTWQRQWRTLHNRPARDIWAPELHYLKQKKIYVLAYSVAVGGTGLLISTTGKPEGPYVNPLKMDARLTGGIDPTIFEDDDGKVYITWGRGGQIAQMKEDLSGFEIPPRGVQVDKSDATAADGSHSVPSELLAKREVAMEGASLFKRNGKYYLGGAVFWNGRYDSVVAMADNIWGPYKHWHEAVPCGGGTNYFQDNDGNWWCCYFGNDAQSPFRERPGMVKIDFEKDGKIFVADEQPAFVLQEGAATRWRQISATH